VRSGGWDVGIRPPMALGVEAAGVITAVGANVAEFVVGDEVLGHPLPLRHQGTWAPLLIASAATLAHKPTAMTWAVVAALPVPALTAEQVVSKALILHADETVLVHGAGGITGGLIVQLAALTGATVIATCGPDNEARVRALGASEVLDYHDPTWPDKARYAAAQRDTRYRLWWCLD
jgi:NADPH:quinone reductase-like Zn-dependent oxidoreductase